MNRPMLPNLAAHAVGSLRWPGSAAAIADATDWRCDWLDADSIDAATLGEWEAMSATAAEANVFAEPWLVLAGIRQCAEGSTAEICVVRDGHDRLVGVVAIARGKRIGRSPLACSGNWSHPNGFLMGACARAGAEAGFWAAVIEGIGSRQKSSSAAIFDGLVEGRAMHCGLTAAAAQLRLPVAVEAHTVRAMLSTDLDADAYWDAAVRAKKRKELRRQWARLGELGTLTVDHGDQSSDAAGWIDEFLALEASGWKGANGSALASNPDTLAFFCEAMAAGWQRGQVLLTALRIDGRAIAMLITLVAGAATDNAGFSFKTAFDEDYARFSPGVLLQRESLSLLTGRKLAFIDSCAAQDHPMIDSLWRERRAVLTLSMPLPGATNRLAWQATQSAASVWRGIKRLGSKPAAPPAQEQNG